MRFIANPKIIKIETALEQGRIASRIEIYKQRFYSRNIDFCAITLQLETWVGIIEEILNK